MAEVKNIPNIPKEKFQFASASDHLHDEKIATKPRSFMRDALSRFSKNKGSVVAAVIVLILVLYAIFCPLFIPSTYTDAYVTDIDLQRYQFMLPKLKMFEGTGFWDGSKKETGVNESTVYKYMGIEIEQGHKALLDYSSRTEAGKTVYDITVDTYYNISVFEKTMTKDDYDKLMAWQDENEIQVILPAVDESLAKGYNIDKAVWYVSSQNTKPTLDRDGNLVPAYLTYASSLGTKDEYTSKMRLASDPYVNGDEANGWSYAKRGGTAADGYDYTVRVDPYNYFIYKYGFEPAFAFGTENHGYDIFTRLASGARFSIVFAIAVAAINLVVGAIYGAIEGYYGGLVDLTMERVSDILSELPSTVIMVLFNLHLSSKVGTIPALLYAFIVTGWIGMASLVRKQFYRFKNQEYVLAARTLGASDWRIMWKHIFPNSLGTIVTSCVLIIPGIISSETTLTYLGIINLDSPTQASVGAMLSAGQSYLVQYPHIIMFPTLFLALLIISFNLFGNGLRDAFNPSLRGSEG